MRRTVLLLSFAFAFAIPIPAGATSFGVVDHDCPVCGKTSKRSALMSYSQFGEPARDLSDAPSFSLFMEVETCPWDLYSAWSETWEIGDEAEKDRLKTFLQQLGDDEWLPDEVSNYAFSLDSEPIRRAILGRHQRLTKPAAKDEEPVRMLQDHDVLDIERWLIRRELEALPVEVTGV